MSERFAGARRVLRALAVASTPSATAAHGATVDELQAGYGAVDAKAAAEIERFLAANAARGGGRAAGTEPRITTTQWFRHDHDEVAVAVFRSPGVKTAANCAACHPGAATGNFDERAVRIPR